MDEALVSIVRIMGFLEGNNIRMTSIKGRASLVLEVGEEQVYLNSRQLDVFIDLLSDIDFK